MPPQKNKYKLEDYEVIADSQSIVVKNKEGEIVASITFGKVCMKVMDINEYVVVAPILNQYIRGDY